LIDSYLKLETRGKVKTIYLSRGAQKAIEQGALQIQLPTFITDTGKTIVEETDIFS
jgi:hypothetical protein